MSIAIFAAGCFWGIEKKFDLTKGVTKVEVGYTGGETKNPTYEQVCYEETGHAEVVRVNFDENIITYKELLNVFWSCHNPTTLNRQGPDIGKQYRSAIFYLDNKQKLEAEESKKAMNESMFDNNIVTEITKFNEFYLARRISSEVSKKTWKILMSLVTTEWLEKNIYKEDIKILDCSWHMPNTKRIGKDEFLKEHIPGSIFFDIDKFSEPFRQNFLTQFLLQIYLKNLPLNLELRTQIIL